MFMRNLIASQWVDDIGDIENLGAKLLKRRKNEELPVFTPPQVESMVHPVHVWFNAWHVGFSVQFSSTFSKEINQTGFLACNIVQQTAEALLESGYSLLKEQQLIMETKLSKEYMKNVDD